MAQLSAVYPVRLEVRDLCAACLFYIDLSIVLGVGGLGGGLLFLLLVCGALGLFLFFFFGFVLFLIILWRFFGLWRFYAMSVF